MVNVELQVRQDLPIVGINPYRQIHLHSTGNPNSTAQNEADYMTRKDINSGYYTHVVGNGRIIQTAPVRQGAYDVGGGWNYETYAAIEIIESHKTQAEFDIDYKLYIELARKLADEAAIPKTLDSSDLEGIKTHHYCTYNQPNNGSDHIDPYPYLSKRGVTKERLVNDLMNGFGKIPNEEAPVITAPQKEEPKTELEEVKMVCIYSDGKAQYYYNGITIKKLTHPDQVKVLQEIYRKNNNRELPSFDWSNKSAPWFARLKETLVK
ncbi:N-acetylmuramoyl-L-alanine amidase [Enterococcus sp. LJL128]